MSSDEESVKHDDANSEVDEGQNKILEIGEDIEAIEEQTEEVRRDETADGEENEKDGDKDEDGEKKIVKPKRVVRNPLPKLNEETIKGPRGLNAIQDYFERVKFKGKGHEDQDLNVIMKTYEYWCHRLFPKFPFDTCIERLEKLGTKRATVTHIKRIRYNLLVEDPPILNDSDEENVGGFVDIQNEEIDKQNDQFDQLFQSSLPPTSASPQPTVEQLERMRLNKERAEKLRQERLKKIRQRTEETLELSSHLPSTSGLQQSQKNSDANRRNSEEYGEEENPKELEDIDRDIRMDQELADGRKRDLTQNKFKKRFAVLDSDDSSDEDVETNCTESSDLVVNNKIIEDMDEDSFQNSFNQRKWKKHATALESINSSEEEMEVNGPVNEDSSNIGFSQKKSRKLVGIIDSDSDQETVSSSRKNDNSVLEKNVSLEMEYSKVVEIEENLILRGNIDDSMETIEHELEDILKSTEGIVSQKI